jgi:hypothetical protein
MTYQNSLTVVFTLRAPASATAPSLPILFFHRLQYDTVVIRDNKPREDHTTYYTTVTELFTLRASASATAPTLPILLLPSLQFITVDITDNTYRRAKICLTATP